MPDSVPVAQIIDDLRAVAKLLAAAPRLWFFVRRAAYASPIQRRAAQDGAPLPGQPIAVDTAHEEGAG